MACFLHGHAGFVADAKRTGRAGDGWRRVRVRRAFGCGVDLHTTARAGLRGGRAFSLYMVAGENAGKKNKGRDEEKEESAANAFQPRRIAVDGPMSVKQQIRLLRKVEEMSRPQKPKIRTSFRRKKEDALLESDDDDSAYLRRRARRKAAEPMPAGKYSKVAQPVCLIDGYNVIGYWKKLKKRRDAGDMEGARELLLVEVSQFAVYRGWQCVIVYDAYGNAKAQTEESQNGVKIIYTGKGTADDYIEQQSKTFCDLGESQVWAVTSDLVQQRVSQNNGAHVLSSGMFTQEIKLAKKHQNEAIQEEQERNVSQKGRKLIDNLKGSSREALFRLRSELDGPKGS
ncbi:protein YacP [Porphyridium purpureum]|uniref:Protein YacP n=1 Tax=Porphyridium purpureum TaxID=35688 RepID=A0A5J4YVN1_PORPP|nr:protein YacP [Porphyridium purpureum]|eukprot:POR1766..scf209_3